VVQKEGESLREFF
jgi:hypothetical protein